MSANPQKAQNSAPMKSLVNRVHGLWLRKKVSMNLGFDFLLFTLMSFGWLIDQEYAITGGIAGDRTRKLVGSWRSLRGVVYQITDEHGKILLSKPIFTPLCAIGIVIAVILAFQTLTLFLDLIGEQRQIRKALAPINEIAIKADELGRMAMSGDKYLRIEEAISQMDPDEADMKLSFGDEDLQGIEAAMNNLIYRMREAYKQQARFVNDASHELRTPISVIQGYANMLSRWGRTDPTVLDESIDAIVHESTHMQHLVEQLLFLARGDSGKTRLSFETVSLNEMMKETYEESLMIDENHIYRFKDSEAPLTLSADPGMLKQAVRILVDNAAKYTKQGDEILLSLGTAPNKDGTDRPYLQVQDTGIGMSEANVAHMFERFYRADEARSFDGTGLGLSIAEWIVDKHGGYFEVLSREELGTRIRIML